MNGAVEGFLVGGNGLAPLKAFKVPALSRNLGGTTEIQPFRPIWDEKAFLLNLKG